MAKNESVQKRLQKVRAPRVQMTYDVDIGDELTCSECGTHSTPCAVAIAAIFLHSLMPPAWERSGWMIST